VVVEGIVVVVVGLGFGAFATLGVFAQADTAIPAMRSTALQASRRVGLMVAHVKCRPQRMLGRMRPLWPGGYLTVGYSPTTDPTEYLATRSSMA
jgi:hypothetical protein